MKRGEQKRTKGSGSIRIISGQWRGRKLPVLSMQGLRPTTDRTKETLFNWLMPYLHQADCLDVFAGSGSLGVEALSRYAASCCFMEKDTATARQIEQNLMTLAISAQQAKVICGDSLTELAKLQGQFDLVFLDPPFHRNLLPQSIALLHQQQLVKPDGLVYLEVESQHPPLVLPENWRNLKQKQTSQVSYSLYQVT